ncbi:MAG: autotransporter outer membrane beta-barrel domain-containing protein [Pseudomonadota bacterium]
MTTRDRSPSTRAIFKAGLEVAITDRLSAGVSYQGQYADNVSDNAVKGRVTWRFN